jgi:hypothetical protein
MIASLHPCWKPGCPTTHKLFILSIAMVSTCGWSQTQLGTVFGTITHQTGSAITGAQISVSSVSTGLKRGARTDITGQYQMVGLPTGRYTVRIEKEEFQTWFREGIAISPAAAIAINVALRVGRVPQQVTATADVPTIDNITSTVSAAIPEQSAGRATQFSRMRRAISLTTPAGYLRPSALAAKFNWMHDSHFSGQSSTQSFIAAFRRCQRNKRTGYRVTIRGCWGFMLPEAGVDEIKNASWISCELWSFRSSTPRMTGALCRFPQAASEAHADGAATAMAFWRTEDKKLWSSQDTR